MEQDVCFFCVYYALVILGFAVGALLGAWTGGLFS